MSWLTAATQALSALRYSREETPRLGDPTPPCPRSRSRWTAAERFGGTTFQCGKHIMRWMSIISSQPLTGHWCISSMGNRGITKGF